MFKTVDDTEIYVGEGTTLLAEQTEKWNKLKLNMMGVDSCKEKCVQKNILEI